ncbi:MAG: SPOR domain-containing protein [Bacteroidales bacterium]
MSIRSFFIAFIILYIPAGILFCQSVPDTAPQRGSSNGNLNINKDPRLDELVKRYISINKEIEGIPGYRIRIFSASGQEARSRATDVRAKFFNKYPDVDTYLVYDAPNFKVYVGDFRTRSEALKMQNKIIGDYPYSFIISDMINMPPLD